MEEPAIEIGANGGTPLWGVALGLLAAGAVALAAAIGIYLDARRRMPAGEAALWAVGALLVCPLALPLYLWHSYCRAPGEAGVMLPWVRFLNYLTATGWAVLIPAVVMGLVVAVLVLAVGDHVVDDLVVVFGLQSLFVGTFVIAWTYGFRYVVDRRGPRSLGTPLTAADTLGRQLIGLLGGAAAPLSIVGGLALLGHAEITWAPSGKALLQITLLSIPLYIAAFMEEIVMRGYVMRTVYTAWGPVPAVLLSALPFALLHVGNPNLSALGLFNIALIGVFFALTVLATGNLWFAVGFHWAWNTCLGPLLALPVSGIEFAGLFRTRLDGPAWLTGGEFGLEASALTTAAVGLLAIAALGACAMGQRFEEPDDATAARPLRKVG